MTDREFKTVEEATQYLVSIGFEAFLQIKDLDEQTIIDLATANWAQGLQPGEIEELEFPIG
jgi:hypothetical protein